MAGPLLGVTIGSKVMLMAINDAGMVTVRCVCSTPRPVSAVATHYDAVTGLVHLVIALWGGDGQQVMYMAWREGQKECSESKFLDLLGADGGRQDIGPIRSLLLLRIPNEERQPMALLVASLGSGGALTVPVVLETTGSTTLVDRSVIFQVGREPVRRLVWLPPSDSSCAGAVYLNSDTDAILLVESDSSIKFMAVQTLWPRRTIRFLLSQSTSSQRAFAWISHQGNLCFGELSMDLKGRMACQPVGERPTYLHYVQAVNCLLLATEVRVFYPLEPVGYD